MFSFLNKLTSFGNNLENGTYVHNYFVRPVNSIFAEINDLNREDGFANNLGRIFRSQHFEENYGAMLRPSNILFHFYVFSSAMNSISYFQNNELPMLIYNSVAVLNSYNKYNNKQHEPNQFNAFINEISVCDKLLLFASAYPAFRNTSKTSCIIFAASLGASCLYDKEQFKDSITQDFAIANS